jgi:hypothetical protein
MKTSLDPLSVLYKDLEDSGWQVSQKAEAYSIIADAGFTRKNLALAAVAMDIAERENPLTLRGLFYQVVSAGWLPSTDKKHYARFGRLVVALRRKGVMPFWWITDSLRSTLKTSSWSGVEDFANTVRNAYRKDFWAHLSTYPRIIVEKDAVASTIEAVTDEYDVGLSVIRGYSSLSFAWELAQELSQIEKPLFLYYLGDFDPSGFDLERNIRESLVELKAPPFSWRRLGVVQKDFEQFNLLPLAAKASDSRTRAFVEKHGPECAELDALPATEIRARVRDAIVQHIPASEWERLQEIEQIERESFNAAFANIGGPADE